MKGQEQTLGTDAPLLRPLSDTKFGAEITNVEVRGHSVRVSAQQLAHWPGRDLLAIEIDGEIVYTEVRSYA